MDEVEPALDDVNLHRFLKLVEGFAAASQVLIVTHQKRTMEIAGMLYGISLNTDGTTKVVAQRLEAEDVPARERATEHEVVAVPATEELASPPVG
jgi:chromosome segregation protein